MKKTFLIGLCIFIFGIICFSVGLSHGGYKTVYWDHGLNIEGVGKNRERSAYFTKVKQLKVSTSNPVTIQRGPVSKIKVTYPDKTTVTSTNGLLNVQGSKHWKKAFVLFGFHTVRDNFGNTVITVPKNTKFNTINCDINEFDSDNLDGHVTLNGLSTKRLSFSGESHLSLNNIAASDKLKVDNMGRIAISSSNFKDGSVHNDFGRINLKSNKFDRLSAETDAGNISFNTQNVSEYFSANSQAGSIDGRVKRNHRTQISASTSVGSKSIFGHSVKKYGHSNIKNPVTYRFITEVGHIRIK
ncbi:DUF4097 family beta strand repeat-containing protein [Lentilactobacillus hilgardii]|jgi:hypothetical protein|uniref:DUF4097 family beta strand repeat protein n=1 Tax=Lentilactobacillus hilgardii TaxID=1588 RepID=A0A6P1EC83_LENHI|nr:DUF4097 family beta strand repeat-containing protein [Lentilactobacillus hilgardii]EEI70917.1 hypothetical protein HMPREF0496_1863 [Lentilactobacillus hilgardii ATCC 27305]MCT3390617.1 hypothetical protein [Lentilactobacillus hilgardii]QHB52861.1 DUF4097 family beta strand repeat protein [Lentilactobacillus hilgardii]RRG12588.1 MAG: hypothetical protein DUD35_00785 [Lactobacillus sp.]